MWKSPGTFNLQNLQNQFCLGRLFVSLSTSSASFVNPVFQGHQLFLCWIIFMSAPRLLSSLFALTFGSFPFVFAEITASLPSVSAFQFWATSGPLVFKCIPSFSNYDALEFGEGGRKGGGMEREKAQLQRRAIPVEKLHPAPTASEVPSVCSQGSPHLAGGALHSHVGLPSGCMPLSQFRRSPRILISAADSVPLVTFSSFSTPQAPQSPPWLFVKCSFYLLLRLLVTKRG